MLSFIDIDSTQGGDFAVCGTSSKPNDPTNDPAHANEWSHERDVRASMIQWLCARRLAVERVDPRGIRILGARVVGPFDLSYLHVPFAIVMRRCAIPERTKLIATTIPHLDLSGSYTGGIDASGLSVGSDLDLGDGFHASGQVDLGNSKVGGNLNFSDGHLRHSRIPVAFTPAGFEQALNAIGISVGGWALLCCGFEADGIVSFDGARIGQDLHLYGGRFFDRNKDEFAFRAEASVIEGDVMLNAPWGKPFQSDGIVTFVSARIGNNFFADHAKFMGAPNELHGLMLTGTSIRGMLVLFDSEFSGGALLDLSGATTGYLVDSEQSWPMRGKLLLDGYTYSGFYPGIPNLVPPSPSDASSRLRWLGLQSGFHSQPYRQLAKSLRETGDDAGATTVLIAAQDARYADHPLPVRLWAVFLKVTIGYGHRPLLAIFWSLAVILVGWGVVWIGRSAGVMRPTWPENTPRSEDEPYEELHPFLYSIDVFFPFVNFHQEHYWWPDAKLSGHRIILGRRISFSGRSMRYYLWFQIAAGWLLSAIFLAGVTGLIRND